MPHKSISMTIEEAKSLAVGKFAPISVLAVGDPKEWEKSGKPLKSGGMAFVSFDEVTEDVLARYAPPVIVSPVLASNFDCIELALLLHNLGFTGEYRAMANNLPKPELIAREVTQMCPRLSFSIITAN